MKLRHHLKSILTKILRDTNNIYFIILLVISTILLIGSLSFKNNINGYIEQNINKNINFRTIQVSSKKEEEDLGKSELLNIEHVSDVYSSAYSMCSVDSNLANEDLDGKITLKYLPNSTTIHTLKGAQFSENDTAFAIIPKKFYPDSSVNNLKIDEKNIIDGEDLIGKTIKIKYYTQKFQNMKISNDEEIQKTFTIIGVYDNKEFMNFNNEIFVPRIDIDEITKAKIPKTDNTNITITQISDYGLNVVVDNLENLDNVIQKIYKQDFSNVEKSVEIDETMINMIRISCYILTGISIIAIIFIISLYIRKKMIRESSFIGILRASGYSKTDIKIQYIYEILTTSAITYILGVIISIIICFILKNTMFSSLKYIGYNITLYPLDITITFIIITLTSIICSICLINKKLKCNIIDLIESRE